MNSSEIKTIIYGRVEPHIYAFQTQKVPRYTKVGDTYRPTAVRIKEWEHIIGAKLETIFNEAAYADSRGDVYFRDYSVHRYLTEQLKKQNLRNYNPERLKCYSNEFFLNTDEKDIKEAITDIRNSYKEGTHKGYEFYNTLDRSPKEEITRKNLTYSPRDIQREVIQKFSERYSSGEQKLNLLMYAVMRFGKSFTVLQCAVEMKAKLVIIVSAKTDVKDSWKETLYEHYDFNEYEFITAKTLKCNGFSLKENLNSGKKFVLFLSLQDLSGKKIKEKHRELFELREPKTLLIIDETHFGARAASYGQVLNYNSKNPIVKKEDLTETVTSDGLEAIKNFDYIGIRIHLSGTPYRILLGGEFADKDIISFVQYVDIVKAQKAWDEKNIKEDEKSPEWENPYYGFPEMIRFAFNPNQESMELISELKKKGVGGLSELLSPISIEKSDEPMFRHEDKVLGLLKAIDGTKEDANIFPFLDYDGIRNGKMCRHMVWVLPFQSSCDAMERLLKSNKSGLKRLCPYSQDFPEGYEIINISGHNSPQKYNSPEKIRGAIESFENSNIKTITLTVNRMLTGSTVKEWDSMLLLKDTSSAQEYDQATFRIQNPYVRTIISEDKSSGNSSKEKIIKINMKPQTLLVDFDPSRMFRMQETKSQFYNGDNANGNNDLKRRIQDDLEISPIIYVSEDKLTRVEANSIVRAVREYSKTRSVLDEASLIPSDKLLLEDKNIIKLINSLDSIDSKKGLEINPFEGEGRSLDGLDELMNSLHNKKRKDNTNNITNNKKESEEEILRKKLKTFYAGILTFAFLSESNIKYLDDIISVLEEKVEDDIRIANNLGINLYILKIVREKASQQARHQLDNRIENIHDLMRNSEGCPLEKAKIALAKFDRLSSSEVATPENIQDIIIGMIPPDSDTTDSIFIDLASKQGELTIAFLKKFPSFKLKNVFSVATSSVAYEMTRKVYRALGIPVENVLLPPKRGNQFYAELKDCIHSHLPSSPNIVVCCPPFQKPKGGGRGDGGSDIYPNYFEICKELNPNKTPDSKIPYVFGMYIKATWNTHGSNYVGQWVDENRENKRKRKEESSEVKISHFRNMILNDKHIAALNDYLNAKPFYKDNQIVTLRGGVNILLWDAKPSEQTKIKLFIDKDNFIIEENRSLIPDNIKSLLVKNKIVDKHNPDFPYIRIAGKGLSILRKVLEKTYSDRLPFLKVSARNIFKIVDNIDIYKNTLVVGNAVKTYLRNGNWLFIPKEKVRGYDSNKKLVNSYNVIVAKGSPGDDSFPHSIISQPRIAEDGSVCSDTYLVIKSFDKKEKAEAFVKYMKTVFFRFMVLLAKNDQNLTRHCYRFVPDIPCELYGNIQEYFGLDEREMDFMNLFIKKWDNENKAGKCLNLL